VLNDAVLDFVEINAPAEETRQRYHAAIGDAARDDQAEAVKIGCHVKRESMAGDPSRNPDANRRELLTADPYAGESLDAVSRDPVVGSRPDKDFLEIADVLVNVAAIWFQVDNRVADNLSRTMVGNVAAAPGLMHLDAARSKRFGGRQDVRAPAVAADAEREDVRMFDENELIVDPIAAPLIDERALQFERLRVRHASELPDD
jgi:hypothetical protein